MKLDGSCPRAASRDEKQGMAEHQSINRPGRREIRGAELGATARARNGGTAFVDLSCGDLHKLE